MELLKHKPLYECTDFFGEAEFIKCVEFHKSFFKNKQLDKKQTKRIITSLIESFHNVVSHTLLNAHLKNAVFKTYYLDNYFKIYAVNTITKEKQQQLDTNYLLLSNLSLVQLKKMYLEQLNKPILQNNNGANTGLILLFLMSVKQIHFLFTPIDNDTVRFELTLNISTTNEKN